MLKMDKSRQRTLTGKVTRYSFGSRICADFTFAGCDFLLFASKEDWAAHCDADCSDKLVGFPIYSLNSDSVKAKIYVSFIGEKCAKMKVTGNKLNKFGPNGL
jgi:hypothetical protein